MSNLKFCTHCGAKLEADSTHCGSCQKSVALMLGALPPQTKVVTLNIAKLTAEDVISELKQAKLLSSSMPSTKLESNFILKPLIREKRLFRGVNVGTKYSTYPFIVAVIEPDNGKEDETLAAYLKATSFKHDVPLNVGGFLVVVSTAGSKDSFALDRFAKEVDQFLRDKRNNQKVEPTATEEPIEVLGSQSLHETETVTDAPLENLVEEPSDDLVEESVEISETLEPAPSEITADAQLAYDDALTLLDRIAEYGLVEDIDDEPHYLPDEAKTDWENGNLASFLIAGVDDVDPECVRVVIELNDTERGVEAFLEHESVVSSRAFEAGGFTITLLALVPNDRQKLPKLEAALREALNI